KKERKKNGEAIGRGEVVRGHGRIHGENIYISNEQVTIDDRKALSVARDNVNSVHREMSTAILSSSLATDVSLIVKDYRLKVGKELNDICNKVSNLTIKVNVKDYVDSIQHDYDFCIDDDDDDDFGEINPYLEKKKKLILESEDYEQTLLFLDKLKEIAGLEQVSSKDLGILFHTYYMITEVYCGLYKIIDSVESSSVWDIDMSLTINESRTKVQNELNYICNNMTNHTIKEAISHHLVGYKAGNRPTKLLPRILAERRRVSRQSEMETTNKKSKLGSGDGEFWSDADPGVGHHDHSKRIKKREDVYQQIKAIFRDCDQHFGNEIGNIQADDILEDDFLLNWDPECLEKGVDVQHDFTVDDSSEGEEMRARKMEKLSEERCYVQHDCNFRNDVDDDDGDFGENNVYLEENKKLNLEAEDYKETIMFMDKLMVIAKKEQVCKEELNILSQAYRKILNVYVDLCLIIDSDASWDNKDATLRIKESRSMDENELSYICNNVSNLTIKEAYSQHLRSSQSRPSTQKASFSDSCRYEKSVKPVRDEKNRKEV
nr:14-3-3-like protein A [Tanacetum cinerariifolium]